MSDRFGTRMTAATFPSRLTSASLNGLGSRKMVRTGPPSSGTEKRPEEASLILRPEKKTVPGSRSATMAPSRCMVSPGVSSTGAPPSRGTR